MMGLNRLDALILPGGCLRAVTIAAVRGLAVVLARRPDAGSSVEGIAQLLAAAVVAGIALLLSTPSILRILGLGLQGSIVDFLLIGLGVAVASEAWGGRGPRSVALRVAFAGLLVCAAPLVLVHALA